MPIYEYRCDACTKVSEFWMKISDPAPTECPKCHKGPMQKKVSQTAFVLEGGGWYSEGYSGSKGGSSTASPKKNDSSSD